MMFRCSRYVTFQGHTPNGYVMVKKKWCKQGQQKQGVLGGNAKKWNGTKALRNMLQVKVKVNDMYDFRFTNFECSASFAIRFLGEVSQRR